MKDTANLDNVNAAELHEAEVWAGYIGGAATHIWTDSDWRRVSAFPKLPIYVTRPDRSGTYCGLEAIMAIYKLGIPGSTAVVADLELLSSDIPLMGHWLTEFNQVLHYFDYYVWKYGSTSYLFDIPPVDGSWVATDSKVKEQFHHDGVHATQFLFEQKWDDSLIHRWSVHHRISENWKINN